MTEIKRRNQKTREERRDMMEDTTRFTAADTDKRRSANAAKINRLRAQRLAVQVDVRG